MFFVFKPVQRKAKLPLGGVLRHGVQAIQAVWQKLHGQQLVWHHALLLIHEAIGILKINDTLFINPGPAKEGHAAILELNGDVINAKLVESSDLL